MSEVGEMTSNYNTAQSYQPTYMEASCIEMNYYPGIYPYEDETFESMGIGLIGFLNQAGLNSCSEELANFETLFPVSNFNFAEDEYGFGVYVNYFSGTGTSLSYNSFGAQSGATFEITEVVSIDCVIYKCVEVTGSFSCRLYNDSDTSDIIDVRDGVFKLVIQSFNNF